MGRDENVSLTLTMKTSVVDGDQYIFWSTSTILTRFLLVDVDIDQTELFYRSTSTILTFSWTTSTRLSFSTGRRPG